ncbi:hypothetical protein HWV62_37153 [Athelia sp. TMB]|nr:hypothetical protein HWV62_37153 [Athelia sp. TMB]
MDQRARCPCPLLPLTKPPRAELKPNVLHVGGNPVNPEKKPHNRSCQSLGSRKHGRGPYEASLGFFLAKPASFKAVDGSWNGGERGPQRPMTPARVVDKTL